jgi:hypothetical protein
MEETKEVIIFGLTSTMSSGNKKMVAPSLRATLIAYLQETKTRTSESERVSHYHRIVEAYWREQDRPGVHDTLLGGLAGSDQLPVDDTRLDSPQQMDEEK